MLKRNKERDVSFANTTSANDTTKMNVGNYN